MIHDPPTSILQLFVRAIVLAAITAACLLLGQREEQLKLAEIRVDRRGENRVG